MPISCPFTGGRRQVTVQRVVHSITFVALGGLRRGAVAELVRKDASVAATRHEEVLLVALRGDGLETPLHEAIRVHIVENAATRLARRLRSRSRGAARVLEAIGACPAIRRAIRTSTAVVSHGGLEASLAAVLPGNARTTFRMHNFQKSTGPDARSYTAGERTVFFVADRLAVLRSDVVVAVSQRLADQVERGTGRRPSVRHNGLPSSLWEDAGTAADRDIDVLFVGRLVREKGVEQLPDLAACLGPGENLVIAGQGPLQKQLSTAFAHNTQVTMLGEVAPPDVARLMRRAKVLVVPSVDEPFGMVVLEGMAAGAAVLASNVGGIPEIVNDGVDGILVAPGNNSQWRAALRSLLETPGRREALAARASVSSRRFDERRTLAALHEAYWGRPHTAVDA